MMDESRPARPTDGRSSSRYRWGLWTLLVVVVAGLVLQRAGIVDALVEPLLNGRRAQEPRLPDFVVQVRDERGRPVPSFQVMFQTVDKGSSSWEPGVDGRATLGGYVATPFRDAKAVNVLVRAEGTAGASERFEGPGLETLFKGRAVFTLRRGEAVELRFRLPPGLRWPNGLVPDVYGADLRDPVRIMWQPENRAVYEGHLPDFNAFNVKPSGDGRFAFRLAPGAEPFYVAVHRPGFLQFFEAGPFTWADITGGVLEIDLPAPASLRVGFDPGNDVMSLRPYEGMSQTVFGHDPAKNADLTLTSQNGTPGPQTVSVTDLAPGAYRATVQLWTKRKGRTGRPGVYRESRDVTLAPGEASRVDFRFGAPSAPAPSEGPGR